jgi:hypothetical protein
VSDDDDDCAQFFEERAEEGVEEVEEGLKWRIMAKSKLNRG